MTKNIIHTTIILVIFIYIANSLFNRKDITKETLHGKIEENNKSDGSHVAERSAKLLDHLSKICSAFNISKQITGYNLQHIHFDHQHKLLYCYVPKVIVRNTKESFHMWMKLCPRVKKDSYERLDVHTRLPKLNHYTAHLNDILKSYKKFMFVRNPFNRVLSAYKDKLLKDDKKSLYNFHKEIGAKIQKKYRGYSSGGHDVTFPEFISFISEDSEVQTREQKNEHWISVHDICNPCGIQYDFIGKYEHLDEDAQYALNWMGVADIIPKFPESDQPMHTKHYDPIYFNQLNRKIKKYFFGQIP
ncbi:unnamed protein product [Meganyctiphanes norvegica]|uniref:Carbohydrate sulfotransferase n=1 Tax=Meganyctiphanes norvegica TaxID=48144 RepID=A0AAV2QWP3_MEGNR